jgi:pteridine reductase
VEPGPVLPPTGGPAGEGERAAARGTLVGRAGRPENVAAAVLHFVDNDFVTGACLPVDGGRTVFAPDPA